MKGKETYNFIDLFAGCGGLSEGFYKEGYKALLHLEIDKAACKTLRTRMKYYNYSDEEIQNYIDGIEKVFKDLNKYKSNCRKHILKNFYVKKMI